jgi:hypothetical protein
MKLSFAPILVVLALLASACGPIRSTVGLIRADQALAEAREMNAGEHAPYPMTLAESLRAKAWEEQGYAQYDTSMNMANEAEKLAREAIQVTRGLVAPLLPAVDDADLFGEADAPQAEGEAPGSTEDETSPPAEDDAPPAEGEASAPDDAPHAEGEAAAPGDPPLGEGEVVPPADGETPAPIDADPPPPTDVTTAGEDPS